MPITNWEITRADHDLLLKVADRALRELTTYPDDKRTLVMDLNACHSNGCPLDFAGLLAASIGDFFHDIYGIRKAIDRNTGKLTEDVFMPRYALANHVPEEGFGIRDEAAIALEEAEQAENCECCGKPLSECEQEKADIWDHDHMFDITPVGMQTPDGNKRVNEALEARNEATQGFAAACALFLENYNLPLIEMVSRESLRNRTIRDDWNQLNALCGAFRRKHEALLRAVAGAPEVQP